VLLVDDNELVAEVLVSLLADAGNDVVTANSAEQALAIVQSAEMAFDAVISDYRLPTLSGLEVIESVRQRWPAATAIILSGDTFDPRLLALSNTGVKVLRKPVRRETLAQALESGFLRGRQVSHAVTITGDERRRRAPVNSALLISSPSRSTLTT